MLSTRNNTERLHTRSSSGWIWPLVGAGLTAATGALLGSLALREKDELLTMEINDPKMKEQKELVFNEAVAADSCFAVAAALATWSLIWYLFFPDSDDSASVSTIQVNNGVLGCTYGR